MNFAQLVDDAFNGMFGAPLISSESAPSEPKEAAGVAGDVFCFHCAKFMSLENYKSHPRGGACLITREAKYAR